QFERCGRLHKSFQIVHDQEPMQAYLSNYTIPIVADWSAFLPIMGPLHVSLGIYYRKFLMII
ncbi:6832_t:CDS:2, partial [Entrophospora sp. SA101]